AGGGRARPAAGAGRLGVQLQPTQPVRVRDRSPGCRVRGCVPDGQGGGSRSPDGGPTARLTPPRVRWGCRSPPPLEGGGWGEGSGRARTEKFFARSPHP